MILSIYRHLQHLISDHRRHTPNIAFRHLPPKFGRTGYATGVLFISAQLSTKAVNALWKGLGTNRTVAASTSKHARKHEARPPRVKNNNNNNKTQNNTHTRTPTPPKKTNKPTKKPQPTNQKQNKTSKHQQKQKQNKNINISSRFKRFWFYLCWC